MEKKLIVGLSGLFAAVVISCLAWLMMSVSELQGDMKLVMYQLDDLQDKVEMARLDF